MRRRQKVAHGAEVAGAQQKILAPATFRPCAMLLAPLPHGLQAVCSALRHPTSKVGVFFAIFTPTCWRHRPCTTFYGIPSSKVGVFMAISSPTFRKRCPYTALCGTQPAKVWVFFAIFTPTFGKRQAPSPLSFRLQKFTLRPSSRPAVHHSAVFCTERSCKCLPYRKRPVFCTACIRKRLAYRRGLFSVPDGESPRGYRALRLRRSNLNTNMPLESNFRARL